MSWAGQSSLNFVDCVEEFGVARARQVWLESFARGRQRQRHCQVSKTRRQGTRL